MLLIPSKQAILLIPPTQAILLMLPQEADHPAAAPLPHSTSHLNMMFSTKQYLSLAEEDLSLVDRNILALGVVQLREVDLSYTKLCKEQLDTIFGNNCQHFNPVSHLIKDVLPLLLGQCVPLPPQ
jgi:hypothetical protein